MSPAVLAALVTALQLEAANQLLAAGASIPSGARVAVVIAADRAAETAATAARLEAAGATVTIVVETSAAASEDEAGVLDLKRALTRLRADVPGAALGVAGSLARLSTLFQHDVAAYVDVAVIRGGDATDIDLARRRLGIAIWTSATLSPSAADEELRRLAGAGADAVLVGADTDDRSGWLLSAAARINEAPAADVAEQVTVVGAHRLSAAEIVARHQAQAVRQRRLVQALVATGHLRVTFEAPGFSAPVVIDADTTMRTTAGGFAVGAIGSGTEFLHRRIRVNGIEFAKGRLPRLPMIEPERVATPPLEIALTRAYRYELEGLDAVRGRRCYVITFEPGSSRGSSVRGRAWIDAATFALLRLQAAQTNLRGPIVSSEQIDEYREVSVESDGVGVAAQAWGLSRSDVRQLYEGAGFRTPIRRLLVLDRHEVNPPDAGSAHATSAADALVIRDTPDGFRYADRSRGTRVPTLVAGLLIDPNITRPLPFAGVNYTDFDLFGTGAQFNGFFGGTYGQAAWSVPSIGGSRWQLAGSAFAVFARYHDRAFVAGREQYDENLLQRPAHADAALVRPLSPRVLLRLGYDLAYTGFARAESTDPAFEVPATQWAHGLRVELQAQRAGWTFTGWWSPARRAGWKPWGGSASPAAFQKWGAGAARTILASRTVTGRVEVAYLDGRDLDRFSRYAFGTFDNRLKGYPSASIRFDRGGVARTAVAWAVGPRLRLDGFFDAAYVRDAGFGARPRGYAGIGAAAETALPFGMLGGVEWGYGFQGLDAGGSRGTHVVRVTAFKIF